LGLEVGPGFAVSQDHAGFLLDGIFAVRFLL
jgi:hypothetical protein